MDHSYYFIYWDDYHYSPDQNDQQDDKHDKNSSETEAEISETFCSIYKKSLKSPL